MTRTEYLILFLLSSFFFFFQFFHHVFKLRFWAFISLIYSLNLLLEAFKKILEFRFLHFSFSRTYFKFILNLTILVLASLINKVINNILHRILHWEMVYFEITDLIILSVMIILNIMLYYLLHLFNIILYIFLAWFFNSIVGLALCHHCWNIGSLEVILYIVHFINLLIFNDSIIILKIFFILIILTERILYFQIILKHILLSFNSLLLKIKTFLNLIFFRNITF
jgi:hypothetical protein